MGLDERRLGQCSRSVWLYSRALLLGFVDRRSVASSCQAARAWIRLPKHRLSYCTNLLLSKWPEIHSIQSLQAEVRAVGKGSELVPRQEQNLVSYSLQFTPIGRFVTL